MARGGARAGAGRPKKQGVAPVRSPAPADNASVARPAENQTPLEFMLSALNDPKLDMKFRAQMAQAAAPFVHPKAGETPGGVKAAREEAARKVAQGSRFRPVGPPTLRTVGD